MSVVALTFTVVVFNVLESDSEHGPVFSEDQSSFFQVFYITLLIYESTYRLIGRKRCCVSREVAIFLQGSESKGAWWVTEGG